MFVEILIQAKLLEWFNYLLFLLVCEYIELNI